MGSSKVYSSHISSHNSQLAFQDRVIKSIMSHPIDLDSKPPERDLGLTYATRRNSEIKFSRKATCPSDSPHNINLSRTPEAIDWLSSAHVILKFSSKDYSCTSSGTVIGPRFVLTLASSIYQRDLRKEVEKHDIEVLTRDAAYIVHRFKVIELFYNRNHVETYKDDLALLVLDKDIVDFTGCFGLRGIQKEEISEKLVYLYGYRSKDVRNHEYKVYQKGPIEVSVSRGMIDYNIDASKLVVGSVLCYKEDTKYYAIAILTQPIWYLSQSQRTIFLNSFRIERIERWIREYCMKYSIIPALDLSLFPYSISEIIIKNASKGNLDHLVEMNLKGNRLGPRGAAAISKLKLKSLRSLNLEGNEIASKGVKHISRGKLKDLNYLNLADNGIGPEGARYLANGKLTNLKELDLYHNHIEDQGVIYIAKGKLSSLISLNLVENQLGPLAAKSLARGNLVNLSYLYLANNKIGDDGAFELSHGNLMNLQTLDVSSNMIGYQEHADIYHGDLQESFIKDEPGDIREKESDDIDRYSTERITRNAMTF